MNGPIGLHGGGEYVSGDEPFLDALLRAASDVAGARRDLAGPSPEGGLGATERGARDVTGHRAAPSSGPVRVVLLPTAAARGRPELAAATGRAAFQRRGRTLGIDVEVAVAPVVDAASAGDPRAIEPLAGADLIHLPGGDPDLVPGVLDGSAALAAIETAWRRGAVVAGASAGAMALAEWTWTPKGGIHGLGFVRGLAVVPHYDDVRRTRWQQALDELAPGGIGYLGLDERTGVLAGSNGSRERQWTVAGPGAAWWFARGADEPVVARSGEVLRLPA